MRVSIHIIGTTPLMMHNERLSDPDDEYTQQIKEITNKRTNQTEQDKALVSKLEWFGGIYTNGSKTLIMPAANIIRCFRATASYTKDGKKLAGGLPEGVVGRVGLAVSPAPRNAPADTI